MARVHYEAPWQGAVAPAYDPPKCVHSWRITERRTFPTPLGFVFECERCGREVDGLELVTGDLL